MNLKTGRAAVKIGNPPQMQPDKLKWQPSELMQLQSMVRYFAEKCIAKLTPSNSMT